MFNNLRNMCQKKRDFFLIRTNTVIGDYTLYYKLTTRIKHLLRCVLYSIFASSTLLFFTRAF